MPGGERILDFSLDPAFLSVSSGRLIIKRDGLADSFAPLIDTAIVVIGNERVSMTGAVLSRVMQQGGALVVCDAENTPVGMMLPVSANNEQTKRMIAQVGASLPTCKRAWKSVVIAKILSQAHTLELHRNDDFGLRNLAKRVRSGDPENLEAQAAQRYWPLLFNSPDFRRRRDAPDQNRLLNYGYAVLRAAMGRAVCASGLHPSVGIHHRSRNNAWVLCDDLMEPYRPLVDDEVCEITGQYGGDIAMTPDIKARLIGILHARLAHAGESRTVTDWIGRTAASLAQVFTGDAGGDAVFYPEGLHRAAPRA